MEAIDIARHEEIPRLSDRELDTLAADIAQGYVFTQNNIHPRHRGLVSQIFLPLRSTSCPSYDPTDVGCIYQYIDQCVNSVSGYPVFSSCRFLHRDDWDRCLEKIDLLSKAAKS